MDTRRIQKRLKKLRRAIMGAPRRLYVHLADRIRERRVRAKQSKGLLPQSARLEIYHSRHDAEVIRSKKNG